MGLGCCEFIVSYGSNIGPVPTIHQILHPRMIIPSSIGGTTPPEVQVPPKYQRVDFVSFTE